jgi:hypothetical protein
VGEAEFLDTLTIGAHGAAIGSDLSLREYHAYIHDCLSTTADRSAQRHLAP